MAGHDVRAYRDHLRHSAVLPLSWTRRDGVENPLVLARRHRRNVAALALDAAGDERRGERPLDDSGVATDLQRIDTKLNAVMELFSILIERELVLPASVPVRFNAHGIEWQGADAPPPELPILIRIHLDACPGLPLELAATVLSGLDIGWSMAVLDGLRAPLPDAIEKMVFREHRRQLADSIGGAG